MAEFIEIIKKIQWKHYDISQTSEKYNKESYWTQLKMGRNASTYGKVFEQATNIMEDAIEEMDIEIEQKDNRKELLENKIGLPDSKFIEAIDRLGQNKISSERIGDMIMHRLKNYLILTNRIKTKSDNLEIFK